MSKVTVTDVLLGLVTINEVRKELLQALQKLPKSERPLYNLPDIDSERAYKTLRNIQNYTKKHFNRTITEL
jgi:uncharacterized protein YwgA